MGGVLYVSVYFWIDFWRFRGRLRNPAEVAVGLAAAHSWEEGDGVWLAIFSFA